MKRIIFLLMAFVFVLAPAFAQRSTTPVNYQLTINVNVGGYSIYIDGNMIKGNVATVTSGQHTIRVTASGYQDYNATVNVTGNTTHNVTMQPLNYNLTIQPNVGNASIYINNGLIKGNVASLRPGSYSIRVTAPGYLDFNTTVQLNGHMTLPVTLQPATATARLSVPTGSLNNSIRNPMDQIQIFVDGVQQKGDSFQVNSGMRRVRVVTGGLQYEFSMQFDSGKTYTLELGIGVNVK